MYDRGGTRGGGRAGRGGTRGGGRTGRGGRRAAVDTGAADSSHTEQAENEVGCRTT